MKLKEAPKDYELQVGDIIKSKSRFMNISNEWTVHRVTKMYAFIMYNEKAEGKFPRKYTTFFKPFPKDTWSTTDYTVLIEDK